MPKVSKTKIPRHVKIMREEIKIKSPANPIPETSVTSERYQKFCEIKNNIRSKINQVDIYNWMILVLIINSLFGMSHFGVENALPQMAIAIIIAVTLDLIITYAISQKWYFPKTAIISALFLSTVLDPATPWYIISAGAIIAILGKHIVRYKGRNIFNPAMTGIFLTSVLFSTGIGWWGAWSLPVVILSGLFISFAFRRFDLTATFFATYYILFTISSIATGSIGAPLIELRNLALLFFMFFMLVEPKTSPTSRKGRMIYGIIAAIVILTLRSVNPLYNIPIGLFVANICTQVINRKLR